MKLEFKIKQHYGRTDFYPDNEASTVALELKRRISRDDNVKCFKQDEIEILKALGHEIRISIGTLDEFKGIK